VDGLKISKDLRALTTTQTEMARALSITQPRIHQLIEEGTIMRDAAGGVKVIESLRNYYNSGNGEKDENELDLDKEKAAHERIKRELSEIKLSETRGEIHRTEDISLLLGNSIVIFRNQLLRMPSKMARQLEGKGVDEMNQLLTQEVNAILKDLSETDVSKIGEIVDEE